MSTSISYKGRVIAAFGNDTKTLNTAGTWLEDDITVTATDSSAAITVTQELDEHGGIIKHINAVDISNDTVDAAHLLQGYTAHDRDGNAVTGTYTGESTPTAQSKTVTPTKLTQNVTPDANYDYLSAVTVNPIPNQYIIPSGTKNITTNGTSDVTNYASVSVNVPTGSTINNQNKVVTPTETQQNVSADSGYTGLGIVTVEAIDSEYVGSDVARRSGTDLTSSGATVSVPAGYYAEAASKSISTGRAATPATSITANPTLGISSTGVVTATTSASKSVTPSVTAGYVSSGTAGTVTVSGSNTLQLTTQAAKTITPTKSSQTAVAKNVYTTGAVTVGPIPSEYIVPTGNVTISSNGTGIDVSGYATATVNVPTGGTINNQNKTVTPTESQQSITADSGYTGLGTVTVNAISSTYVGSGVSRFTLSGQDWIVTPTEEQQEVMLDGEYLEGGNIYVGAIPSNYVGSAIDQNDSTDLTVSGATVTVPAGYYADDASKSIASGSATTPATTITANPTISVNSSGLITASVSGSQNVTPTVTAGYVSSGTAGTVSVSGSKISQLTTQAAKTVTPTETEQNAVAAGVYTTGIVKVGAISSTYVGSGITQRDETDLTASGATVTVPAGYYAQQETKSVSTTTHPSPTASVNSTTGLVTASHTQGTGYVTGGTTTGTLQLSTAAAATITPTKSSQTAVAAGKYTTGAITVAAIPASYIQTTDATATAADIISGETAYVDGSKVTGTLVVQHYYTGSTAPSSSLGENGDIYLQA